MPITVISNIIPANNLTFPIVEDIHLKGGLRVVDSQTERDNINATARKAGMYVYVISTGMMYYLDGDLTTWLEVSTGTGGSQITFSRATVVHTTDPVAAGAYEDFTLPTGKCAVLLEVGITDVARVEAHSRSGRSDLNPYVFESYVGHLNDDGSYLDSGMNLKYNRRYTTLANLETPANSITYWRIINQNAVDTTYQLTVTYLTIEQ